MSLRPLCCVPLAVHALILYQQGRLAAAPVEGFMDPKSIYRFYILLRMVDLHMDRYEKTKIFDASGRSLPPSKSPTSVQEAWARNWWTALLGSSASSTGFHYLGRHRGGTTTIEVWLLLENAMVHGGTRTKNATPKRPAGGW